jgi:hypothetical protein
MPAIAILDDRKDKCETMSLVVASMLKKLKLDAEWSVISDQPTPDQRDVLNWLDQHDATVLVTDWRLNEGATSERVVNYEADSLIRAIRARRPAFPIFVVTGFEPDARADLKDVENVFSREYFTDNLTEILPQMVRAGLRRYEQEKNLLSRMDKLARKVAIGKSSAKDRTELSSLKGYFQAEMPAIIRLDEVLTEIETMKKAASVLRRRIEARLRRKKGGLS